MAFTNEKISDRDMAWVSTLVTYESISAIWQWVHRFSLFSSLWTVDRDKGAFLIHLGGGVPGHPDGPRASAVLILDGKVIVFNFEHRWPGNSTVGYDMRYEIYDLFVPSDLKSRCDEIKQLIFDALEESAHSMPFADGGTVANPNMTARWNIKSFSVEYK